MTLMEKEARLTGHESWGSYHRLRIFAPEIAKRASPGQFVMVRINESYLPLLRRPFSLHHRLDDEIEIFFKVVGQGTAQLAAKKEGDKIDILGPLGRGFSFPARAEKGPALLIAGGRGIAPFLFLAHELRRLGQRLIIFYGGKTKEDLPLAPELEDLGFDLRLSTEDGRLGFRGLVTELLVQELPSLSPARFYVCGPEGMLAEVARISREWQIPAEFSLEARMGCGFGVCYGCVWPIRRGEKIEWTRICLEGPVFPAEAIAWERKK